MADKTTKTRTPTRELFDALDAKLDALDTAKADLEKASAVLSKAQESVNMARERYGAALADADAARDALNSAVSGQTQPNGVTLA